MKDRATFRVLGMFAMFTIALFLLSSISKDGKFKGGVKCVTTNEENISYDSTNKPYIMSSSKSYSEYDRRGDHVLSINYRSDNYFDKNIYLYDTLGLLISRRYFLVNNNDTIYSLYEIHTYDEIGREIKFAKYQNRFKKLEDSITYLYNDIVDSVIKSEYDSKGKLVKAERYRYDKKLKSLITFNYKKRGRFLVKEVSGQGNKSIVIQDKKMKPIGSEYYNPDDILVSRNQYYYNKRGDIRISKAYSHDTLTTTYTYYYTYDKRGNWITDSTFINNKLIEVAKRVIEYY